jgi:type VI secretion system protein ImpL
MYFLRSIFRKIFNRTVLTILLLLMLSALIWFVGPIIAIGQFRPIERAWVRWCLIAAVWLLWFIKLAIRWWRERNVNAALLNQLAKMQSTAKPGDNQAAGSEEVAELNKRFKDASEILKKTRFSSTEKGGFLSGFSKQYVYQLPWYAFIGAPGSGKTTALINAGLTFPLAEQFGKAAIRGVGGTRNCDWWFTNEAVLIDTAGRYTTQESNQSIDKAEWQGFLGLLKKFRPRQPLNGVLLTISIADLLQMTAQEREVHAATLKARLNELREGLGVQFPVYVLVTKTDLLSGFTEYFLNYTREERAQVWGFTLPYKPDSTEPIAVREAFAREFDLLYKRLNDGMHQRLLDEPDLSRRALAYTLPQQLVGIRDVLSRLLASVFSESKFAEQPVLRGVYFTSGTQEGTPFDRVLGAMQRTFRVQSKVRASDNVSGSGKSFFLQDLLQKVIFPEHFIAGRNLKAERKLTLLRTAGIVGCALLFVAANVAWWLSYRNNVNYIAEVATKAESLTTSVAEIPPTPSEDAPALLATLNQSRDVAVSELFPFANPPWSYRYGLFQGTKLDSAAQSIYGRLLDDTFMPRIATRLDSLLRAAPPNNPEYTYQALKAYLMLFDASRIDAKFIKAWIMADWKRSLPPDFPNEARAQLGAHLDNLIRDRSFASPFPQNAEAVKQARAFLSQQTTAQRNYSRIKSRLSGAELPEFTLLQAAGTEASNVFVRASGQSLNAGVLGYYSVRGYHEFFKKELLASSADMAREDSWVMGLSEKTGKLPIDPAELIRNQTLITRIYLTEYAKSWDDFNNDIRLKPSANLRETIQTVRILAAPDSPLTQYVRTVSRETTLLKVESGEKTMIERGADKIGLITKEVEAVIGSSNPLGVNVPSLRDDRPEFIVQGRFSKMHALTVGAQGAAPIDALTKTIQEYLFSLEATEAAQRGGAIATKSQDVELRLKSEAANKPTPVREVLLLLTDSAAAQTAGSTRANTAANVKGSVGQSCGPMIAGRYPIARGASQEILPADFAQLFAPGGLMDDFFQKNLASSVDKSRGTWVPRPGADGAAAGKSADLAQFQKAEIIRDAFFSAGSRSPGFEVEVRITPLGLEKIELDVDGTVVNAAEGSKLVSWPGPKKTNQVKLTVGQGRPAITTEGNWALHRLIDKGTTQPSTSPERVVVSLNADGREVTIEFRARSVRNPLRLSQLQSFSCPGRG